MTAKITVILTNTMLRGRLKGFDPDALYFSVSGPSPGIVTKAELFELAFGDARLLEILPVEVLDSLLA